MKIISNVSKLETLKLDNEQDQNSFFSSLFFFPYFIDKRNITLCSLVRIARHHSSELDSMYEPGLNSINAYVVVDETRKDPRLKFQRVDVIQ